MTREIKFRAWYGQHDVPQMVEFAVPTHFPTMQFTGLKDKNGKEIYESDYLGDWCVYWGSGKYILQNISTGDIIDCNEYNTRTKEITGNQYENPREHTAMASDI